MWTRFMDMHSGGGTKIEPYQYIYIEAPQSEAEVIFYNRFGRNPNRVTCTCCGEDYSISESTDLAQATAYERGCHYGDGGYIEEPAKKYAFNPYCTLEDYMKRADVLFIPASHIKPEERIGSVPRQGFIWIGDDE